VTGIERVFAICIQLSLSIIVFHAVYGKNKLWLYPFAIILHALVDIPAAAIQIGVIKDMVLVELLVFLGAIGLTIIAKYIHKRLGQNIMKNEI
jgi:uncharacterized membrane protein YhfC